MFVFFPFQLGINGESMPLLTHFHLPSAIGRDVEEAAELLIPYEPVKNQKDSLTIVRISYPTHGRPDPIDSLFRLCYLFRVQKCRIDERSTLCPSLRFPHNVGGQIIYDPSFFVGN
jgi:hypothetical protein